MSKVKSNLRKPTTEKSNPIKVYEYLKTRAIEVSREEIVKGTGLSRDQVKQVLHRFKTNGVAIVHEDEESMNSGVLRYSLHPKAGIGRHSGMDVVKLFETTAEDEEAEVLNTNSSSRQPLKESDVDRQGESGKHFLYQQGYSRGYNDAMFHSHRDAYQAGKKVVIEGLLKLLKVDAKVLMS